MIKLFNTPLITSRTFPDFENLLHDKIVREFEEVFAGYVGGKYAVSFNSATSAITALLKYLHHTQQLTTGLKVPSIIPPVVPNAIIHALSLYPECNWPIWFTDETTWVGGCYKLHAGQNFTIWDSAHEVIKRPAFNDTDIVIYSFYPTKVVGSCDGGMIISNNKELIDDLRIYSMNGMTNGSSSWERRQVMIGEKIYMNSIQACIAMDSFGWLPKKKEKLAIIRGKYNEAFSLQNTSEHLYRISVPHNQKFVAKAMQARIQCGMHYGAAHHNLVFRRTDQYLPLSDNVANTTVSIPYHEALTTTEIAVVIDFVLKNKDL